MALKVTMTFMFALTFLWLQRSWWALWSVWPCLWPQKVTGLLEVAVTYFMTPTVTVTFGIGLTYFMTPKGHRVIRGHHDLYDPKCYGDLYGQFNLVYDPKMSQGHYRSLWPTLWPQRSPWPLWLVWPSLWPQKVTGSLEVVLTHFMTQRSRCQFYLFYDPKGHGVIRGRLDLLYDPKCHGDLCGRFDLVYDPKSSSGH